MKAKYSKSTGGIYVVGASKNIPTDALDIPDALYTRFTQAKLENFDVFDGVVVEFVKPPPTLDEVKTDKFAEIRKAYDTAASASVTSLGKLWNGGFESAIKLDAARRLSEAAGAPSVKLYDINNIGHQLNFSDALQVCVAVASEYQIALSKKQGLFAAVEAVQVSKAVTEAQAIVVVTAITW